MSGNTTNQIINEHNNFYIKALQNLGDALDKKKKDPYDLVIAKFDEVIEDCKFTREYIKKLT